MSISDSMYESSRFEIGKMSYHVRQNTIGDDVVGYTQKHISTTLIEHAIQRLSIGRNIELTEYVTRIEAHL